VQQAVEDGGGERFVAGEQFGPFADRLVGRDEDGAATVAVGDEPEEQAGLVAGHGLEAELVDDQQAGVEVLASAQSGRRQVGVGLERQLELVEAVELGGEAVFDGLHAQADGEMGLADAGRALDEHGLAGADVGAGGQRVDAGALHGGLEGEVEVGQREAGRQAGQPKRGAHATRFAALVLGVEHLVEEGVGRDGLLDGLAEHRFELVGGVGQAQRDEPLAGVVDVELALAHRAASASAAKRSMGRCSTGCAAISCRRRPMRPSGVGGAT